MYYHIKWKNGILYFKKAKGNDWQIYTMLPSSLVKEEIRIPGIKLSAGYSTMQYLLKNRLAEYHQDTPNYEDE